MLLDQRLRGRNNFSRAAAVQRRQLAIRTTPGHRSSKLRSAYTKPDHPHMSPFSGGRFDVHDSAYADNESGIAVVVSPGAAVLLGSKSTFSPGPTCSPPTMGLSADLCTPHRVAKETRHFERRPEDVDVRLRGIRNVRIIRAFHGRVSQWRMSPTLGIRTDGLPGRRAVGHTDATARREPMSTQRRGDGGSGGDADPVKRVWRCLEPACGVQTWAERSEAIQPRASLTERALEGVPPGRGSTVTLPKPALLAYGPWATTTRVGGAVTVCVARPPGRRTRG
jgi:hypothetical protein